ncbi:hypothetical protein [Haladaptatus sp. T7]|uniref:hypothetical protein n=1 Tax=Haladaptatus sp. T7 TaxID=2029368 RepID=UPI0021A257F5|nr:hypothetical protein [Haladaptatus sp. T7]GKZ14147.1 hypothetical protein HAL_20280 [Haladaptatus sp. T7]
MGTAERGLVSWVSATVDFLLAVFGFIIVLYPMVSLGNAVFGSPASASTIGLVLGVLAVGGAYPMVAGDWSLGQLGEYVFVLTVATFGWGLLGMIVILVSGLSLAGSNPVPRAIVWVAASLTAYIVVYRTRLTVLD